MPIAGYLGHASVLQTRAWSLPLKGRSVAQTVWSPLLLQAACPRHCCQHCCKRYRRAQVSPWLPVTKLQTAAWDVGVIAVAAAVPQQGVRMQQPLLLMQMVLVLLLLGKILAGHLVENFIAGCARRYKHLRHR